MFFETLNPFEAVLILVAGGVGMINALLLFTGLLGNNNLTNSEKRFVRRLNMAVIGWTIFTMLIKSSIETVWIVPTTPCILIIVFSLCIVIATYKGVSRN